MPFLGFTLGKEAGKVSNRKGVPGDSVDDVLLESGAKSSGA